MSSLDRKRPIEERVAALMGKSAYRDLRDGLAGTGAPSFTDQDVAAAIGAAAHNVGKVAVMALETFYGSTLLHQAELLRAWEEEERKEGDSREEIVLTRFGGALAIQQMAGSKVPSAAYSEYAYLIFSRRERLEARVRAAGAWLEGQRESALRAMKIQIYREAA